MKKMYKQPVVEKVEMMPQTIICASVGLGGTTGDINNGSEDPHPRRIKPRMRMKQPCQKWQGCLCYGSRKDAGDAG